MRLRFPKPHRGEGSSSRRKERGSGAVDYLVLLCVGLGCAAVVGEFGGDIHDTAVDVTCQMYRGVNPNADCAFDADSIQSAQSPLIRFVDYHPAEPADALSGSLAPADEVGDFQFVDVPGPWKRDLMPPSPFREARLDSMYDPTVAESDPTAIVRSLLAGYAVRAEPTGASASREILTAANTAFQTYLHFREHGKLEHSDAMEATRRVLLSTVRLEFRGSEGSPISSSGLLMDLDPDTEGLEVLTVHHSIDDAWERDETVWVHNGFFGTAALSAQFHPDFRNDIRAYASFDLATASLWMRGFLREQLEAAAWAPQEFGRSLPSLALGFPGGSRTVLYTTGTPMADMLREKHAAPDVANAPVPSDAGWRKYKDNEYLRFIAKTKDQPYPKKPNGQSGGPCFDDVGRPIGIVTIFIPEPYPAALACQVPGKGFSHFAEGFPDHGFPPGVGP